jgi:16S rRNA pseudouridine516 synthase
MRLAQLLYTQGFGSRREVAALVARGAVHVAGAVVTDPDADFDLVGSGLTFEVNGIAWPYAEHAWLMLHKPAGTECSRAPSHHASVLNLLPLPLRVRGVQPVGRLDQDTTGLLLFTDDGSALHRLTSPRHHVRKTYEVDCAAAIDPALLARLLEGVRLHGDSQPARALDAKRTGERSLRLVIDEGRYHQVKRMLAAVGNRVTHLHRSAFGPIGLPADLAQGQWRWLNQAERHALQGRARAEDSPGAAAVAP